MSKIAVAVCNRLGLPSNQKICHQIGSFLSKDLYIGCTKPISQVSYLGNGLFGTYLNNPRR